MRSYTVAQPNAFRGLISDDIVYGLNKHGYGYFTCTFKIDVLQINTIHQLFCDLQYVLLHMKLERCCLNWTAFLLARTGLYFY